MHTLLFKLASSRAPAIWHFQAFWNEHELTISDVWPGSAELWEFWQHDEVY